MMNIAKSSILTLVIFLVRCARAITHPKTGTIFMAPDIPISNLGDQALLLGALEGLSQLNVSPIHLVANGPEDISKINGLEKLPDTIEIIQSLHIIFSTDRAFVEKLKFFWLTRKVKSLVLVGADVIDGRYNPQEIARKLAIISQVADLGVYVKIVGFSLSENITPEAINGFKKLAGKVDFVSREEISQQRMLAFSPCKLGADCAFLMSPKTRLSPQKDDVFTWLEKSGFTVGLCLRIEDFWVNAESDVKQLEGFTKGLLFALNSQDAKLLLIPHHPKDILMLKAVATELDKLQFTNYFLITDLPSAMEIKAYSEYCDHVVTSRMHVAIATLGMKNAVTCLPYAGKFEGLFKHFELQDGLIDRNKAGDSLYTQSFLTSRFEENESIKDHIDSKINDVKALSLSNFVGL